MKTVLQIILGLAIIALFFFLGYGIWKPINFKQVKEKRYDATIQKLKDIRTAQLAYKDEFGQFTGSFDTLINFIKTDSLNIVKAEGRLSDSLLEAGVTEKEAVKRGIIRRDTIKVAIKDSLFSNDFNADKLWKVPYTKDDSFQLGAKVVETGNVEVPIFEAKVHNDILLRDLDKQLVINLNERMEKRMKKYPGLKVGDLEKPNNNAGNWE
jgi:hypothetical protein